jgi:hypothetical protein
MEYPGMSSISENTSQKMYIRIDNINGIVNDLDSDGGSFSEPSDSDMCNPSAAAAAVAVKKRKVSSQNLTEAGRECKGPFLNAQIQILS